MLTVSDQRFPNGEAQFLRCPEDIVASAIGNVHGASFLHADETRLRQIKCSVVRSDHGIMRHGTAQLRRAYHAARNNRVGINWPPAGCVAIAKSSGDRERRELKRRNGAVPTNRPMNRLISAASTRRRARYRERPAEKACENYNRQRFEPPKIKLPEKPFPKTGPQILVPFSEPIPQTTRGPRP